MTHDPEKEAFFLRFWPSLICILIACFFIVPALAFLIVGFVCYHSHKCVTRKKHKRLAIYVHQSAKGLDCWFCATYLGGWHDETISNRAARLLRDMGVMAPRWARVVGAFTEYFDPGHMARAIERLRDEEFV